MDALTTTSLKLNKPEGWRKRIRRTVRQIGPMRVAGTFLILTIGLLFARFGWSLPLAVDAERALYDARVIMTAPQVAQDERIVLVVYTDDTLRRVEKRSPLDRRSLAQALTAIDSMDPKGIAIDILIDQPQAEDPLLIDAMRRLRTPTHLAYATRAFNPEQMEQWQQEFLDGFIARVAPGAVRPTSIRLQPDADGVQRRWPDQPTALPPLMANSLSPINPQFRQFRGGVAYRLPSAADYPVFSKLPIDLFVGDLAPAMRSQIEGRYVLIGGDIQDQDDYETPLTRGSGALMKGLEVHAHLLAQTLDGHMPDPIPAPALWAAALGVIVAGALTSLLETRGWRLVLILGGQAGFLVFLPFALQAGNIDTLNLPAAGWGIGWVLAFAATGTAARAIGAEQRRFAQSALGKYLPRDIAAEILRDPERLSLSGEKRQIYALFTDLEGFTKLSHAIPAERLSSLLNTYLDLMSEIVLRHGGTIDKFVGDAVVAFWGAPISRPDDADRAALAAIAMFEAGEEFARTAGEDLPPIGCTRVGLHRGEAVVGNFGGEGRIQYTALGDGMNTAARLESANKYLNTTALVSSEAREACTLDLFRPMGRIALSGRATPVAVWEPAPHLESGLRSRLVALWVRFDGGDLSALTELEEISAAHQEDAALAGFVYRIREVGPGGHYVLGSK